MKMLQKISALAVTSASLFLASSQLNAQTAVDLELILLTDVSGSISTSEYNLQKTGYVNAFQDAAIHGAILGGSLGKIAVTYVEWSSSNQQSISVGWTLIDSVASSNAFANAINATVRPFSGGTSPDAAINFATPLFSSNLFSGSRWVIDVSGDGTGNAASTALARDNALLAGVDTINGITIGGSASLDAFYNTNVIGGAGAFLISASTFQDFENAIQQKLFREITNTAVPEPSTYGLMGAAALAGLVIIRRRKAAKSA